MATTVAKIDGKSVLLLKGGRLKFRTQEYSPRSLFNSISKGDARKLRKSLRKMGETRLAAVKAAPDYCERNGHDWQDNSFASTDYGDINLRCRKCGATCYKVLY